MRDRNIFIKTWALLFIAALAALLVVACTDTSERSGADDEHSGIGGTVDGNESKSTELILAVGAEPDAGFDPTTGWGRYGSPLFQSTLLKRDARLNIEYDVATDYDVSVDGLSWTIQLRDDVRFSDGQPLTADDVVYTFETAAASGSVVDLTVMESVEALNDTTVRFTLKKPRSTFVSSLVSTGIVPKHLHNSEYAQQPVGSGPYQFVQWDKGQQLIVEANPYYYGKHPYFKRLTFLFLSEDTAFAAARSGQVDMARIPAAFGTQQVAGMRKVSLESVDNRGIVFPYVASGGTTDNGNPLGNDVTSDVAIRKAINLAVDRQALVEGVLEGFGRPAYTAVDGLPWWNPQTVVEDGDTEGARRLLEEAGWTDADQDGVMEKGSMRASFNLLYPASDLTRQSLALAAADMIREAGIEVHVEGKSWEEIERRMSADAVLFGWGSHDPLEMYRLHSSTVKGIDFYNPGHYANPVVDDWMEKALTAQSEEQALEYWQQAQWDGETGMSAHGDAPWAWLVNIDHLYLVRDGLEIGEQSIQPHMHGWPVTDNIVEWKWQDDSGASQ